MKVIDCNQEDKFRRKQMVKETFHKKGCFKRDIVPPLNI
jgi:hypothetical protein